MKVPPKRKGNLEKLKELETTSTLNESPSEKEGKFVGFPAPFNLTFPSMKVPPKRKGNEDIRHAAAAETYPQ